jgi:uncharacterized lipoprotein YbaY/heat shock protein HslJ
MKDPAQLFGCLLLISIVTGMSLLYQPMSSADEVTMTGTASYRERIALPPAAVFEAMLEDISRTDVRAEVLGSVRIEDPGSPPFSFGIAYDPAQVQANRTYAVRARISAQGRLLFTTDQVYPVLTHGHGQQVELLLRRSGGSARASRTPLPVPATFAGELPCADCSGQRIVLTLFPDQNYRLRRTYRGVKDGHDEDFYELGRWEHSQDQGSRLVLHHDSEQQSEYRVLSPDRLRLLDKAGNPIDSALNYDLERRTQIDPLPGPMRLRGLYAYMDDAATFNECHTGKRYRVSLDGAHIDIEQAYLTLAKDNPGVPLLATLEGRFEERMTDPSTAPREYLIVERFERFWPGETCAREALAQASLSNTYWRPVEIDGEPVTFDANQREPHFVLRTDGNRVRGFTGCNRVTGGFEQDAGALRFKGLTTTRMACPPGIAQLEARFLDALNAITAQRILGESLELRDASGQLRMRLESRYLR